MSAELLDYEEDQEEPEQQITSESPEDTPEELIQSFSGEVAEEPRPQNSQLPDKYSGKTIQEVVEMHQSAESLIGKHSAEVGELRQFVDGYIKGNLNNNPEAAKEEPEEEIDFFEDPDAAINKAIERHPTVRAAQQQAQKYRTESAMSTLQAKHEDLAEIVSDPIFASWVNASKVRQQMYHQADQGYDADSADELVSNYKAHRRLAAQTIVADQKARKTQVQAANTGTARGSAPVNQGASGKVYRRQDLIKLMVKDPERYESLSDEILKAYSEGRVR
tara:strand:- start:434 stop:1264 length:831 start_codon:yes stop_codon:yes gene_type:complete